MMRVLFAVTLGAVTLAASAAVAQPAAPQQPPPLTNLQLYPKDTPRPQLVATMQGFVQALGVQSAGGCGYCHAGTAPAFDFASDAKPAKTVARKMILMAREITAKLPEMSPLRDLSSGRRDSEAAARHPHRDGHQERHPRRRATVPRAEDQVLRRPEL